MTTTGARTRPSAESIATAAKERASLSAVEGNMPSDPTDTRSTLTEETVNSVFSAIEREGRWTPADDTFVRAIFGAVKLDFTMADLPPSGVIDLDIRAIFGSVEIIVPDGAEVILDGTPIFGSVEQKLPSGSRGRLRDAVDDAEPVSFHIVGQAIFGSIEVIGR